MFYTRLNITPLFCVHSSPFRVSRKVKETAVNFDTLAAFNAIFWLFDTKRKATLNHILSSSSLVAATESSRLHPLKCLLWIQSLITKRIAYVSRLAGGVRNGCLPWLSVEVLFMSPEMKEDSDCFLTVSFHIRLMRLWVERKAAIDQDSTWCRGYSRLLALRIEWLHGFVILNYTCLHDSTTLLLDDVLR